MLGPLGQSVTAARLLGTQAHLAVTPPIASALDTVAILYGVPVFGFIVLWATLAAALTVRTIRRGVGFGLTWWSFTFPVGTCVTGTTQLALHTNLPAFRGAAVVAYALLLGAWLTVAIRTGLGSYTGRLLARPAPSGPVIPAKH